METDIKIKVCISEVGEVEGSRGLSATTSTASYDRALVVCSNESAATANNIAVFRKRRKKLSGAARKRMRRERERAQAAQLSYSVSQTSSETWCSGRAGVKRRASFDSDSSFDLRKKLRMNQNRAETCDGRAVLLTRAIVTEAYPEEVITPEEFTKLREAFCKEIREIQEDFVPKFLGTSMLRNGAVVLTCADEPSLNWLVERIGHISPWEGAKLRVVGLDALRQYKAVAWIPGPAASSAKIMALLEKQNSGLRTSSWQIIAENVAASENGRNIIFSIPESSVHFLRTLNFKLFFGLEEIVIKIERQEETASDELARASRVGFHLQENQRLAP